MCKLPNHIEEFINTARDYINKLYEIDTYEISMNEYDELFSADFLNKRNDIAKQIEELRDDIIDSYTTVYKQINEILFLVDFDYLYDIANRYQDVTGMHPDWSGMVANYPGYMAEVKEAVNAKLIDLFTRIGEMPNNG